MKEDKDGSQTPETAKGRSDESGFDSLEEAEDKALKFQFHYGRLLYRRAIAALSPTSTIDDYVAIVQMLAKLNALAIRREALRRKKRL